MRRREFITPARRRGGDVAAVRGAQQPAMPKWWSGCSSGGSPDDNSWLRCDCGFRQGLNENGYVEGQNVAVEYRWARGRST